MKITEIDKWECFSDAAYYDRWAVRNTKYKSFNSAIHVGTKEEAEFLVTQLSKLDLVRDVLINARAALKTVTLSRNDYPNYQIYKSQLLLHKKAIEECTNILELIND